MRGILRATLVLAVVAAGVALVGSGLGQWVPRDRTPDGGALMSPGEDRVTVDVRNAGGVAGMARTATDHLRAAGFDVVSLGNATAFGQQATVVIDRVGDPGKAAAVARAMGTAQVTSEPDSNLFVDVTVRLGSAWSPPSAPPTERRWTGVADWLRGLRGPR